jgi:hypothetical protein
MVGVAVMACATLVLSAAGLAAETPAKPKAAKSTKSAKAPAVTTTAKGDKMLSGGTVRVESTKASGAGIVTKSRSCVGDTPKIAKVQPDEGKPGDRVTVTGVNFGAPGCLTTVSFGPGTEAKFSQISDTSLTTTVPTGAKRGLKLLTLTAATGEDSKPFLVK